MSSDTSSEEFAFLTIEEANSNDGSPKHSNFLNICGDSNWLQYRHSVSVPGVNRLDGDLARRASMPVGASNRVYSFYHRNRAVSVFGSDISTPEPDHEREFSLSFAGGQIEEEDLSDEEPSDDDSSVWDDLVNQISLIDDPSRQLRAGSIGFEMQKQRKSFEPGEPQDNCCDLGRVLPFMKQPVKSKDLQFAEKAGFKMMPSFFFPAVPKLLEDIWVVLEIIIVLFDFIFNCVVYSGAPLDILVIAFSVVAVSLALLDTILYFADDSSCKRCSKSIFKRLLRKKLPAKDSDSTSSKSCCKCTLVSDSMKKKIGTWLQIIRTLVSELILFPLTLADLVELIEIQIYAQKDVENRINFGLFIIGVSFLVLTVYFMRIFMALSSIASVTRLPKNTGNDSTKLIVNFCIHLMAQIVMHATIFIMISSKLHQETCRVDFADLNQTANITISVTISPFLWYQISSGAFIPLAGTLLFFLLNYPAIKQLSVSMYIDIMTSVVNESFADLVFQGEGLKTAKKKASKVAEKAHISTTKTDFEKYKRKFAFWNVVQYRLTNPLVVICSLLYGYVFIGFFVTHCFGYQDPCNIGGGFKFLLIDDIFITVTFFVGVVIAVIANYQLLFAVTTLLILGTLAIILSPILLIVLLVSLCVWAFRKYSHKS